MQYFSDSCSTKQLVVSVTLILFRFREFKVYEKIDNNSRLEQVLHTGTPAFAVGRKSF